MHNSVRVNEINSRQYLAHEVLLKCEKYYQNKLNSDEFKGKYITLNFHDDLP